MSILIRYCLKGNDVMTTNSITINKTEVSVKEYQGNRVVTLKDIDECHGRSEGTARKRFNDNKEHFIEGVDFYAIDQPSEIRTLGITRPQGGTPQSVTLVTESGYLMLVKSFTDDLAWDVQRQLVNTYFRVNNPVKKDSVNLAIKQKRVDAMTLNAKSRVANQMMKLWDKAGVKPQYQAIALNEYYDGLSLPRIAFKEEKGAFYDLTSIAKHLGVMSKSGKPHAQAMGVVIEKLKPLDEGECELTPYSRNGHDGVSSQYTLSVEQKIKTWLVDNEYPERISGNGKSFSVRYANSDQSKSV